MTYNETVNWMFNRLPMYQSHGASAYKEDLDNTIKLCDYLGNPQDQLKFIHVAGTNGKGSTSHMIASILQEAGYKTGLYTSPHLKDFRERIKINGVDIPESYVTDFISKHKDFFEANELSFFEMTVGLAFDYYVNQQVDIAIIEVGLGGRLDATNVITPLISVITNIGIDHTQILGNTIELIAAEKAGIIKEGVPVVIGERTKETKVIFREKAKASNSEIYFASKLIKDDLPSDLIGNYQVANKKTALQTIRVLQLQDFFHISEQHIYEGLQKVIVNTGLRGRWQQLHSNPKVICDTAHNRHGLEIVLEQVKAEDYKTLHIVMGVVNDKDLSDILPIFPQQAKYYFCKPDLFRGLDAGVLQAEASQYDLIGEIYKSVSDAYAAAMQNATAEDFIFIGGSTFVVAEIL
ncbi:MAG TPA: folylpolyglutamate synthase/dihydrofolate synthase family protein [Flavobacterium sp.]|nr:folylpolyglutamate synthase/dihydrofolate synthase family protein [Flavobacterium sp.]